MKKKYFECCINCAKRNMSCHSVCEEYIRDKKAYDEEKKKIDEAKSREAAEYCDFRRRKKIKQR